MSTRQFQSRDEEVDVYDFDTRIARTMAMIKSELSDDDVFLIERYDRGLVSVSLSKPTRCRHLGRILSLSRMLKKKWSAVSKADIENLVYTVMNRYSGDGKETNTTSDHKKILKIFFRWMKLGSRDYKEVGDPLETKWIKIRRVTSKIVREQLITEKDLSKLLGACINPRDRAFFDVHYEAGTRPSEILGLRIKHVKFDKNGAFINVDGKTGPRPVRLIRSVPNLSNWINVHPFKDEPKAPLWILTESTKYGYSLTYSAACGILRRGLRRARINKRVNLKLFRHSEATNTANFMTEAQMRIRYGWTESSKMPANYVHLVNADVDKAYLKHFGMKTEEQETITAPKTCLICKVPNSPESDRCNSCGKPLDLKKAIELEEKQNEKTFLANKLASKVLLQMLSTKQIPDISKEEMALLVESFRL